jgi:hypothetical protein
LTAKCEIGHSPTPDTLGGTMASPHTQTMPQRLAAIREQMSLLTDYL